MDMVPVIVALPPQARPPEPTANDDGVPTLVMLGCAAMASVPDSVERLQSLTRSRCWHCLVTLRLVRVPTLVMLGCAAYDGYVILSEQNYSSSVVLSCRMSVV